MDEIRAELFGKINEVQAEYVQKGWMPSSMNLNKGIIRGMIEIWAWGLYQLYSFLAAVLNQILVKSADGSWLNLHCEGIEVEQKAATKAGGTVYFTRAGTQGNVPIPAGRVVRTLPDGTGQVYRFVTTADAVLPDGSSSVAVPVESEEYGNAANVAAGQITEIVTTIPGIDVVENRADWLDSEGADTEADESLKQRYTLKWQGNNGCNKYAYEGWARGVAGVAGVRVIDRHPRGQGTVDVVIRGTAGVPTEELLLQVDAVIRDEYPINDDALVKGVTPVDVALSANLVLLSGDPDTIVAEVTTRLTALFSAATTLAGITPLRIGEDLVLDRLVAVIMAVDGIKEIEWVSPMGTVVVPEDGLAVFTEMQFTTTFATEA